MQHVRRSSSPRIFAALAAFALCLAAPPASPAQDDEAKQPFYREYKGVSLGMTAADARAKLGRPTEMSDAQDFYNVSDRQTVQVHYGADKKVSAIAITYLDAKAGAPDPKSVFGADVEARTDGSVYKMERYTKAGCWVSYSRTAGSAPLVVVMLSKIQ